MANFLEYNPEQGYLLPPSVKDVLGEEHLCFFVHRVVEKLDLREFETAYSEEGHPAYHPALLLKVWLYAYALGVTSSRRLEQRIREDLAFRYLAGGAQPDFWALNEFRKRHRRAINDVFTQVVELARSLGLGKLGHVAIDSTRIAANAAADSADTIEKLRSERAKIRKRIRHWQQQCEREDPNEGAGTEVAPEALGELRQRLAEIPGRLQRLKKAAVKRLSRTDEESRFLRDRRGFTMGYTATLAVSEDHLIVAQQISQQPTDNALLVPMVEALERECDERPQQVSGDSGFFSLENLQALEERKIDAYVPDYNMARVLNRGGRLKQHACHPVHQRMRRKLRSPAGRATYQRRKKIVETGPGNPQRATRDAPIPDAWAGEGGGGVCAGNHGAEPDAAMARRTTAPLRRLALQAVNRVPSVSEPKKATENLHIVRAAKLPHRLFSSDITPQSPDLSFRAEQADAFSSRLLSRSGRPAQRGISLDLCSCRGRPLGRPSDLSQAALDLQQTPFW